MSVFSLWIRDFYFPISIGSGIAPARLVILSNYYLSIVPAGSNYNVLLKSEPREKNRKRTRNQGKEQKKNQKQAVYELSVTKDTTPTRKGSRFSFLSILLMGARPRSDLNPGQYYELSTALENLVILLVLLDVTDNV